MSLADLSPEVLDRGQLSLHPMIELLGLLFATRRTGELLVSQGRLETRIYAFNGLPVFSTTTSPGHTLLDVMVQDKSLSPEDLLQVQMLAKEKGDDPLVILTKLHDIKESQIYYYEVQVAKEIIIKACGFREGQYAFRDSDEDLMKIDMYDLNPLELIYNGMVRYHITNLAEEIFMLEQRNVRLNPQIRDYFLLPGIFYEHSHILDLFISPMSVGRAITVLQKEFNDLNQAVYFLYLLLVTRLMILPEQYPEEIIEDIPGVLPQTPPEAAKGEVEEEEKPEEEKKPEPRERKLERIRESIRPEEPAPLSEAKSKEESAAPAAPISTGYVISLPRKRAPVMAPPPEPPVSISTEREPAAPPVSDPTSPRIPPLAPARAGIKTIISPGDSRLRRERLAMLNQDLKPEMNWYEALGVSVDTDAHELQERYLARLKTVTAAEAVPELTSDEKIMAARLRETLDYAFQVLSNPEPRIEYERAQIEGEKNRAWNMELKKSLARRMEARGQWYLRHNAPLFAKECFEQAIAVDPEQATYYMNLGWALFRNQAADAEDAKGYLRSALKISPRLPKAHYYLGVIAKREGNFTEAEQNFRQALDFNPSDESVRRELALLTQHEKQKGFWQRLFGGK